MSKSYSHNNEIAILSWFNLKLCALARPCQNVGVILCEIMNCHGYVKSIVYVVCTPIFSRNWFANLAYLLMSENHASLLFVFLQYSAYSYYSLIYNYNK